MLKRVSIQNFKSLKDVTLDLQKVNLLIGPNNSGKTNFLKALATISETDSENSQHTLPLDFHLNKDINQRIRITLVTHDYKHAETIYYQYTFLKWDDTKGEKSYKLYHTIYKYLVADISELEEYVERDTKIFERQYGYFRIYKPDPNKLLKPGPTSIGADTVNHDASNMIGFFDKMLGNKYRKTVFGRIENDLHKCIPDFDGISIDDSPSTDELKRLYPEGKTFKKLGLINYQQDITYWADELSEGTLYFLALLCIINQPNPPKLLLLEEPEKGIHPRRIREVMDFIFRLAEEKDIQIILTTHNEHVLDDFATRPESVFVFDKDDEGATYVRNLQTDIIEPTNQRNTELGLDPVDLTTNLSDNWLYGLLGGVPPIV